MSIKIKRRVAIFGIIALLLAVLCVGVACDSNEFERDILPENNSTGVEEENKVLEDELENLAMHLDMSLGLFRVLKENNSIQYYTAVFIDNQGGFVVPKEAIENSISAELKTQNRIYENNKIHVIKNNEQSNFAVLSVDDIVTEGLLTTKEISNKVYAVGYNKTSNNFEKKVIEVYNFDKVIISAESSDFLYGCALIDSSSKKLYGVYSPVEGVAASAEILMAEPIEDQLSGTNIYWSLAEYNRSKYPCNVSIYDGESLVYSFSSGVVFGTAVGDILAQTRHVLNNPGHALVGFYDDDNNHYTDVSDDIRDDVNLHTMWVEIDVLEENVRGTVNFDESKTHYFDTGISVVATNAPGYVFAGWYNGIYLLDSALSAKLPVPQYNATFNAKWVQFSYETNNDAAGNVEATSSYNSIGDSVVLRAIETDETYTWLGWYKGGEKVSDSYIYTMTIGEEDALYTATWESYTLNLSADVIGNSITVNFDINDEQVSATMPSSQTIYTGESIYYVKPTDIVGRYLFAGWYSTADCTGEPFDFTAELNSDVTLYAKWCAYNVDTSSNTYYSRQVGETGNIYGYSKNSSSGNYIAFVPLVSQSITIYSSGSWDTYGYLYSSNMSLLSYNDDGGINNNFSITYSVKAGQLYYIKACGYSSSGTMGLTITGTATPADGGNVVGFSGPYSGRIKAGTVFNFRTHATSGAGAYVFNGWYVNGILQDADYDEFEFVMPYQDANIEVKYRTMSIY
ncbi:MAG: InlB B-repeat-containing protein [Christensenellales bacterium]